VPDVRRVERPAEQPHTHYAEADTVRVATAMAGSLSLNG
jgi:hypothetical protein